MDLIKDKDEGKRQEQEQIIRDKQIDKNAPQRREYDTEEEYRYAYLCWENDRPS